jgi:hypothetical protein
MVATNFTTSNISSIKIDDVKYNLKSVPFHATEAEWLTKNYVPKAGEIIIYDADEEHSYLRFKVGNNSDRAHELPFELLSKAETELYINAQIASAGHLKRVVLGEKEELPALEEADENTIYMKSSGFSLVADTYDEYMVINGAWEKIGSTRVDLSGYLTSISAGPGLKATKNSAKDNDYLVEIDTEVVFVLNCGSSTELID